MPAEDSTLPGAIETQPPVIEAPAVQVPAQPTAAIQREATVPARPAVLENPVGRIAPPPVLEPLPPTTQAMPAYRSQQLAVRPEPVNCGVGMPSEPLAARPPLTSSATASLPPRPPIAQAETLPSRPAQRERTNTYARALPPRREVTAPVRRDAATAAPTAPRTVATRSATLVTAAPVGSANSTTVAPAAHERPASGYAASDDTTLAIVAEAPTLAKAPTAAPVAVIAPVTTATLPTTEPNPNQGRGGWIFVR
jgi:hypothetical protein